MKILKITVCLIFFFNSCFASEKNETTRFIAVGHLYPMIDDKKRLTELFKKINSHDPDYVFILGDSKLHKIEYIDEFNNNLKGKIFYSPGNHEVKRFKSDYEKNVGYLNQIVEDKNARFILLNSSDTKENVQNFLKKSLNTDKSIYILTHHRIWDDTLMSKKSYEHDKSYYFEDIYPLIKHKVKAIFAGNSKRQHFRDLSDDMLTYGKQNVNLIYWLDKIGEMELYSIGMGDGKPKANFVVVDISGDEMFVRGDYSSIENYDVLPRHLISPNEQRLNMFHDTQKIKDLVKSKYYLVNKKKIIFVSLILIGIFLILILKIYRKNEKQP